MTRGELLAPKIFLVVRRKQSTTELSVSRFQSSRTQSSWIFVSCNWGYL